MVSFSCQIILIYFPASSICSFATLMLSSQVGLISYWATSFQKMVKLEAKFSHFNSAFCITVLHYSWKRNFHLRKFSHTCWNLVNPGLGNCKDNFKKFWFTHAFENLSVLCLFKRVNIDTLYIFISYNWKQILK